MVVDIHGRDWGDGYGTRFPYWYLSKGNLDGKYKPINIDDYTINGIPLYEIPTTSVYSRFSPVTASRISDSSFFITLAQSYPYSGPLGNAPYPYQNNFTMAQQASIWMQMHAESSSFNIEQSDANVATRDAFIDHLHNTFNLDLPKEWQQIKPCAIQGVARQPVTIPPTFTPVHDWTFNIPDNYEPSHNEPWAYWYYQWYECWFTVFRTYFGVYDEAKGLIYRSFYDKGKITHTAFDKSVYPETMGSIRNYSRCTLKMVKEQALVETLFAMFTVGRKWGYDLSMPPNKLGAGWVYKLRSGHSEYYVNSKHEHVQRWVETPIPLSSYYMTAYGATHADADRICVRFSSPTSRFGSYSYRGQGTPDIDPKGDPRTMGQYFLYSPLLHYIAVAKDRSQYVRQTEKYQDQAKKARDEELLRRKKQLQYYLYQMRKKSTGEGSGVIGKHQTLFPPVGTHKDIHY